jgi:superfamily I DNA/RNA helicase
MGVEEGIVPHDRSKLEGTVDEERRLLYVGITRARETLALTWCRQRIKYGSPMPGIASSFLKEFDPELVEHMDVGQILNAPVAEEKAAAKFDAIFAMLGKL